MSRSFTSGQPERNIESLISDLRQEDSRTRMASAQALGNLKDLRAVDPLIQTLHDKHWQVRCNAARALGNLGDRRAVEPLIACLKHLDKNTRVAAAQALGNLGDPRAIEPLTSALKSPQAEEVFTIIGGALGKLGVSSTIVTEENAARANRAKKANEMENSVKTMLIGLAIGGISLTFTICSYAFAYGEASHAASLYSIGTGTYSLALLPGIGLGAVIFLTGFVMWLVNRMKRL